MADNKPNYFARALITGLSGFIVWIIAYSFLSLEPKGVISTGIITLIIILVVIALSESFDNFSVGKMLTMSRDIKAKESSINKLNTENTELRRELVSVVNSISQKQSSTNIIGLPDYLAKNIGVEKATDDEITKKRTEESEELPEPSRPIRRRVDHRKLEEIAFAKFLQSRNLTEFDLIQEAKLVTQFSGIDPVSNIQPIYDGYINTGDSEIFIEVKLSKFSSIMIRERIYLMLNKIYLYNKVKNANAHLNILLVDIDDESNSPLRSQRNSDRLKEYFEPSIVNGLLRIIPIEITEEEKLQIFSEQ